MRRPLILLAAALSLTACAAGPQKIVAGTAAGAAMAKVKEDRKREINARVRGACISDPLARR